MSKKVFFITILSVFFYIFFLACIGLFGDIIQDYTITGLLCVLKYGAVFLGFLIAGLLPVRISKAIEQRKEEAYNRESERKILEAAEKEKKTQEKILEEYIKNEDAI